MSEIPVSTETTSAVQIGRPPATPPRDVTPRAARRAWGEPRVRFWWAAAFVLLILALYFSFERAWTWSLERRLIEEGVAVKATIESAGGTTIAGKRVPPESHVTLNFELNGVRYASRGFFSGQRQYIIVGSPVDIRVDPNDPNRWTIRQEPPSLPAQLVGGLMLLPGSAVVFLASLILQRQVLRIWRDGQAQTASVADSQQTALAPRSRLVRCKLRGDAGEIRLVSVYLPTRIARPRPGDLLWLVFLPKNPERALAAVMYE